jgi:gliding motility-associated lipoprotein GldH
MGHVHRNLLNLSLILGLFSLASCDDSLIYEENKGLDGMTWKASEPITFQVDIQDTLQACNFYFNLRHGEDYSFSNIFVFMKTTFPNGEAARDTMEFTLQQPDGKWIGSGLGDLRDNQILFKQNLKFPLRGTYTFSLEQAMRQEELPHVSEVGLRIAKFEAPK